MNTIICQCDKCCSKNVCKYVDDYKNTVFSTTHPHLKAVFNCEYFISLRYKNANSNKEAIRMWQKEHPNGLQIECARDTGITRQTVSKYWNKNVNN